MTDRPIIFSGPMVRALLEGRKTQTRRIIKPQPYIDSAGNFCTPLEGGRHTCWGQTVDGKPSLYSFMRHKVRFAVGDRLWVRENWCHFPANAPDGMGEQYYYQASNSPDDHHRARIITESMRSNGVKWRPSIHMPRHVSRLTLTVTSVKVERLQDISEQDAKAEGVWTTAPEPMRQSESIAHVAAFASLWDSINGPGAWSENPWVVALTFTVEQRNIDNWRLVA